MFSFFYHWFSPLFFGCLHCWLHFFMSPTFFTINVFWCFLSGISYLCCWTASATDLRKLFFTLRYLWHYTPSRGGSRTAAASKVELFVIIVNGWKPLTIITKSSTLDIAAVLDPSLPSLHFLQYRSATDLRELFLPSGAFYLTLLPDIWHNLLLSRLPLESVVFPWRLQGLPLSFET